MRAQTVQVATLIDDLAGLPLGTRIATNTNMLLIHEETEAGRRYWIEEGQGVPYQPLVRWLPAIVLPPVELGVL